jgi:hypothetical protein
MGKYFFPCQLFPTLRKGADCLIAKKGIVQRKRNPEAVIADRSVSKDIMRTIHQRLVIFLQGLSGLRWMIIFAM